MISKFVLRLPKGDYDSLLALKATGEIKSVNNFVSNLVRDFLEKEGHPHG
jgi:predicted HicB family RNase H-like nuclease